MQIAVTPLTGSAFTLDLNPSDTVATLRAAVAQQTSQAVASVRLRRSSDQTLIESGTLADYGFSGNQSYQVSLAPPPRPSDPANTDPINLMRVSAAGQNGNIVALGASTVDAENNVYVSGSFTGSIDFDPGDGSVVRSHGAPSTANGSNSLFLAKYLPDGTLAWVRNMAGATNNAAYGRFATALAVDNAGNIVLGARSTGEISLNSIKIGGELKSNSSGTLMQFNSRGELNWSRIIGNDNIGSHDLQKIAIDSQGNVIAAGRFSPPPPPLSSPNQVMPATVSVVNPSGGSSPLLSATSFTRNPVFVVKLSQSGSVQWIKLAEGGQLGDPAVQGLSVDDNGKISVGGYYFDIKVDSTRFATKEQPTDFRSSYLWQLDGASGSTQLFTSLGGDGNTKPFLLAENIGGIVNHGATTFVAGNVKGLNADLDPDSDILANSDDDVSRLYLIRQVGSSSIARLIDAPQLSAVSGIDLSRAPHLLISNLIVNGVGDRLYASVLARPGDSSLRSEYQGFLIQLNVSDLSLLAAKSIDSGLAQNAKLDLDPDGKLLITGTVSVAQDLNPGSAESVIAPGPVNIVNNNSVTDRALFLARWEPDATDLASYGPTVAIRSDQANLLSGQTSQITFELSKPSNDFALGDVTVTNGALSNFQLVANTNNQRYTALFTPSVNVNARATLEVAANTFSQLSDPSKRNSTTSTLQLTVNTTPPQLNSLQLLTGTNALQLQFSQPLADGQNSPAASTFVVDADGTAINVTSVAVSGSSLILALASAVAATVKQVTVRYTDPSATNDSAALQDLSGQDAATFTGVLSNAAPSVVVDQGLAATPVFKEGPTAAKVIAGSLKLSDSDSTAIATATVQISNGLTTGDLLSVTTTGTPITASYDAASGKLTLMGQASAATYQQVLSSISFSNNLNEPGADQSFYKTIKFKTPEKGHFECAAPPYY